MLATRLPCPPYNCGRGGRLEFKGLDAACDRQECKMIGVFVTFRLGEKFDEQAVRQIAETARARFEGMAGLRSKAFTFSPAKREAVNFYVWDSEDAARAFFTDQLVERVTGLYGARPSVEFVEMATLVENGGR
jgi:hypothetical protein